MASPLELDGQPPGGEGHEGLPGRARRLEADGVLGETLLARAARDLLTEDRAHRAVDVADRERPPYRLALLEGRRGEAHQLVVEGLVESVVLRDAAESAAAIVGSHEVQEPREVELLCLEVLDVAHGRELVHAADHLVDRSEAEPRHVLAEVLGDEAEEVDHGVRVAGEALP